jgi:membrane associated rhomboid family serine protease
MNGNYYRPGPVWGQRFAGTMVGRIILINVVVFFLQHLIPIVNALFALRPRMVVENFFIWQLVSYMFLHGGFGHIFFNMLMLWLFGSTVESVWGPRHFLRYYIFCGVGGALFSMIFSYNSPVVGASGAIFGLYLAYAMMFPDSYVYLMFLIPIKAKYLVAGLAVFQLANGLAGPSGVAYFAHLGGMAAGLLFFRGEITQRLKFSMGARRRWKSYVRERRTQDRQEHEHQQETDNIDSILDKISEKGYPNLSTTEKRILENYSRKRKEESE